MLNPKQLWTKAIIIVSDKFATCADGEADEATVLCKGLERAYRFIFENSPDASRLCDSMPFKLFMLLFVGFLATSVYLALTEKMKPLKGIQMQISRTFQRIVGLVEYLNMYNELKTRKMFIKMEKDIDNLKSIENNIDCYLAEDDDDTSDKYFPSEDVIDIGLPEESVHPPVNNLPTIIETHAEILNTCIKRAQSREQSTPAVQPHESNDLCAIEVYSPPLQSLSKCSKYEVYEKIESALKHEGRENRSLPTLNRKVLSSESKPKHVQEDIPEKTLSLGTGIFHNHKQLLLNRVRRSQSERLDHITAARSSGNVKIKRNTKICHG